MTREEAIDRLKEARAGHKEFLSIETLNMAIKTLEQEPCEDAISRQAVLDMWRQEICYDRTCHARDEGRCTETFCDFKLFEYQINHMSPVNPQEPTGHWILKIEDWNKWICSECGYTKRTDIHVSLGYDFCPMCGAKMD